MMYICNVKRHLILYEMHPFKMRSLLIDTDRKLLMSNKYFKIKLAQLHRR